MNIMLTSKRSLIQSVTKFFQLLVGTVISFNVKKKNLSFTLPSGKCNHYTNSAIYHYDKGKFKLFQEIETSYAVQWMAVQVS